MIRCGCSPVYRQAGNFAVCLSLAQVVFLLATLAAPAGAVGKSTHSFNSGMYCYGEYRLPDTSTQPYSAVAGDDASYQPALISPSFTLNGNGTTTDRVTGLVWASTNSCYTAVLTSQTWVNALGCCESLTLAGYTDWRLPNSRELESIYDYGVVGIPSINKTAFPNTSIIYYWTSTTRTTSPSMAYVVRFNSTTSSLLSYTLKTSFCNVRCVRGRY